MMIVSFFALKMTKDGDSYVPITLNGLTMRTSFHFNKEN
jgi:hypothetical protein